MTRLNRTRLLFGDTATQKLQNATVMVVGCGAVGSFAIEALARTGIGRLVVVDFDRYDETNINRQLFATETTLHLPKVQVAQSRIHDINPDIQVTAINAYFDADSDIPLCPDYIIDAIDTVESKVALYKWAHARKIPFVSSMGAASKTDPTQIRIAPISRTTVCPLASRVRKLVRDSDLPDFPVAYSTERPVPVVGHAKNLGSVVTVTGTFGLILANWVIQEIIQDI